MPRSPSGSGCWSRPSRLPAAIAGRFFPYRWQVSDSPAPAADADAHDPALTKFAARIARFLTGHGRPGAVGTWGAETGLVSVCWVLGGWVRAYRTGRLPDRFAAVHADPGYTADDLRAAAPEPVVAELVDLARILHTNRTLADWGGDAPGRLTSHDVELQWQQLLQAGCADFGPHPRGRAGL
jgi:hypothetical protein